MTAEDDRLAYLERLRERLRVGNDAPAVVATPVVEVAPVPDPPPPPAIEPTPAIESAASDPLASMARRIRRSDASAIALIARKLATVGEVADAQTLALVARRLAKLTGAHQAYEIAGQVLAEVQS